MRRVKQAEAKRGTLVQTFDSRDALNDNAGGLERAARMLAAQRELVYAVVPYRPERYRGQFSTWQVYLLP
jgi:hypothetical protein